ncbi:MAG: hypothetical protein ACK4TP_06410 [Hyphomicrobium sp.]
MSLHVKSVVLCDDIRQEKSGKFILIGAYLGTMLVSSLPARLKLSWWILATPAKKGKETIRVRLMSDGSGPIFTGELELSVGSLEEIAIVLPPIPVELKKEGAFMLEWQFEGTKRWQELMRFNVRLNSPSVAEQQAANEIAG